MADDLKPAGMITDRVTTGAPRLVPAQQNRIGVYQPKTRTVSAHPFDEYVSAGQQIWAVNYLRSLAFAVDDLTADFGDDLYDRMLLDAKVRAAVDTFIMAVLSDGVDIVPSEKAYAIDETTGKRTPNPDYARAKELSDFVGRNLSEMAGAFDPHYSGGLYQSLYDLMLACAFGNRVAEMIYALADEGPDEGKIVLRALKVKPRRSTAFVIDVYNNVVGLLALVPGIGAPILIQGLVSTVDKAPNLLPRRKFCVLTWMPKNADPRGTSMLRPAYDPWWVKQQIKQERLRWLTQLAGGFVSGETAPDAQTQQALNPDGSLQNDPTTGDPVFVTPEQAMVTQLAGIKNGAVVATPAGSKVNVVFPPERAPFDECLDRQDREIEMAILHQTRMTMEAQHGSKADSQTGQDVFGLLVAYGKQLLASTLRRDVVAPLIEYNFGSDALALCPDVSLTKTEQQDFAQNATAVATLYSGGYLVNSQLKETDAMLGLPIREEEGGRELMPAGGAGDDKEGTGKKEKVAA